MTGRVEVWACDDVVHALHDLLPDGIGLSKIRHHGDLHLGQILSVKDEMFFRDRPALPRALKLPRIQDAVVVYGYPVGGSGLAVTRGEVVQDGDAVR